MVEIVIDGERVIGKVNPLIFGQNLEHLQNIVYGGIFDEASKLSDARGFRKDVVAALQRIRPRILRWPGGNFASGYHWKNGIGPKNERPVSYDLAWSSEQSNRFGTEEFIEYCRAVGAEPYITVNAGSGTPEEAAHWVEYCNWKGNSYYAKLREICGHPEPHNVKYWSIGNEMWGDFQIGALSAEEYARKCRETAKLMKRTDPGIKLTAVGETLGSFEPELYWNLEVLKTAGDLIDYLSIHRYYYIKSEVEEKDYYNLLACPIFSEMKLNMVVKLIDVAKSYLRKDKDIKISMDEWNFRARPLCSALATARFFNVLQRLCNWVTIGGFFPAFLILDDNRLFMSGGLMSVEKEGILLESSYCAFDLYANHTGEIVLDTRVQSEAYDAELSSIALNDPRSVKIQVPYVDSSATLSTDGRTLFIATVNAHKNEAIEAKVRLRDLSVRRAGRVFELNGPHVMASNNAENPNEVKITRKSMDNGDDSFFYEFPPHSATVIELQVG
mgnify:CR=1 FL=1